jgi:hypothetical protein
MLRGNATRSTCRVIESGVFTVQMTSQVHSGLNLRINQDGACCLHVSRFSRKVTWFATALAHGHGVPTKFHVSNVTSVIT